MEKIKEIKVLLTFFRWLITEGHAIKINSEVTKMDLVYLYLGVDTEIMKSIKEKEEKKKEKKTMEIEIMLPPPKTDGANIMVKKMRQVQRKEKPSTE